MNQEEKDGEKEEEKSQAPDLDMYKGDTENQERVDSS